MNKHAYDGGQLLGDLLAAAGAGARGYAQGHQAHAAGARREGEGHAARYSYLAKEQGKQRVRADNLDNEMTYRADPANYRDGAPKGFLDDPQSLKELSREAYLARRGEYAYDPLRAAAGAASGKAHARAARHEIEAGKVPYPTALAALSGLGPVNDHIIASPLATLIGQMAATGLLQRFAPTASPGAFAGASAAGALAGRLGLRGVDALVDAGKPERAFEEAAQKTGADKSEKERGGGMARGLGAAAGALVGTQLPRALSYGLGHMARMTGSGPLAVGSLLASGHRDGGSLGQAVNLGLLGLGALGGGYLGNKAVGALQNEAAPGAPVSSLNEEQQRTLMDHHAQLRTLMDDGQHGALVHGPFADLGEDEIRDLAYRSVVQSDIDRGAAPAPASYEHLRPEDWGSIYKMPHVDALVNRYGRADHPAVDAAVYAEADKLLGR